MNLFLAPFVNALFAVYYMVGNFGLAIIIVTLVIRLVLLPLVMPSLKSAKRIRELQPKLNKLKEKFGKDKQALAKAQMDLYKQEGVNPLSGCLPQIIQIAVLLLFFYAFNMVSLFSEGKVPLEKINNNLIQSFRIDQNFKFDMSFFGSDLIQTPAKIFSQGMDSGLILPLILLLGSGFLQYLSAKLMMPAPKVSESIANTTKDKEDDMMAMMRTQSTYMMPLMTIFIGWSFSLGLLLYWFITSGFMVVQQIVVDKMNKTPQSR
ncbi:MAG: YidC/Oxa1 family membrane protein insertase [Candidatus Shapirobacteria bacterium]